MAPPPPQPPSPQPPPGYTFEISAGARAGAVFSRFLVGPVCFLGECTRCEWDSGPWQGCLEAQAVLLGWISTLISTIIRGSSVRQRAQTARFQPIAASCFNLAPSRALDAPSRVHRSCGSPLAAPIALAPMSDSLRLSGSSQLCHRGVLLRRIYPSSEFTYMRACRGGGT